MTQTAIPWNTIVHGDSYEFLLTLPDKSFDAIIIDPPYGMGIDAWDIPVDVAFFTEQINRLGKEFYAVFGQMPYIREWDRQAEKQGFHFLEHISWVKRNISPQKRLCKTHEDILVYAIGKIRDFYCRQGKYEDVKIPGMYYSLYELHSYQRQVAALWQKIQTGKMTTRPLSNVHKAYQRFNKGGFEIGRRFVNFTNVWSFLPENLKSWADSNTKKHSTVKPILLAERLVEMLTPEQGSVLDCFSGSGTTAIACQRLKRNFLCIEQQQDFYEQSLARLTHDTYQPELTL